VQLCAFDALMLDGDDLRKLPLSMRKTNLARLLARRPEGIFVSDFKQGEIGQDFARPASSASRAWCLNTAIAATGRADRRTG
jgi:ATP-dependent DNA ligase